jgi:hypothetical protein
MDSAIRLGTKRNPRRTTVLSWERWLSSEETRELQDLRFSVSDLETSFENLQTSVIRRDLALARIWLERLTSKLMRKALDSELEDKKANASDHTLAWKVFDSLKTAKPSVPIPPSTLVDHFENVMAPKNSPCTSIFPPFLPAEGPLTLADSKFGCEFSREELTAAVNLINMSSAPGPDGVTPKLAKDLFRFLPFFLFFLLFVNFCFFAHWTPDAWRIAEIFVLYKGKGDPCSPDSYRGISLCSIFAKVYERLLMTRLLAWWKSQRRSSNSQFGFRLGSSTLDAVFVLRNLIHFTCRQHRLPLHAAFIDLRKAFPSISRVHMFAHLRKIGVPTPLLLAIRSFYVLNAARLRVGNCLSRPFLVSLGLLEGSILSPLLFVIVFSFVWDILAPNDFPDPDSPQSLDLNGLWILAFADDLVILSPSRSRLAEALKTIDIELAQFNLQMSLQKTETMTFLPRQPSFDSPDPIVIRATSLLQVDSFRYLGLHISPTGSLYNHLINVSHKAKISASLTVNLLHQLAIQDVSRIKTYFLSFVLAQFHGLELLPISVLDQIETTRNSFLRQFFRLPTGTPSDLFYVLFPAFTPAILCLQRRLAFFKRSLRHDLPCVTGSFILDATTNYKISCGWMYDSFLIYRSLYPHANPVTFDFLRDVSELLDQAVNEVNFSFVFIQKSKMVCMSFFQRL